MDHERVKTLTEFNLQLVCGVFTLIESSLHGVVLNIKLDGDGGSFLEGLVSGLLLSLDLVYMGGECGESGDGARAILAHILEHRREDVHASGLLQGFEEQNESAVCVLFEHCCEFLDLEPCDIRIFGRVLHHADKDLRESRRRSLDRLGVTIEHSRKAHDLGDCHVRLCSYATHALGELGEIRSGGGAVLRQLIYDGAHFQK